jgi:hypothetical protein
MIGPRHRAPVAPLAAVALASLWLGVGCGPESYHRSAPEDAAQDLAAEVPGTGGAGGDNGEGGASCSMAGNGGVSGDASVPAFSASWTFDGASGLQGWSPVGQPADVVAATTAVLDPQYGFPDPGSARLVIPFNGASQQVAFGYSFSSPQNFSGKVLTARVRLNSCNPSGTVLVGLAYKSIASLYLFASSSVPTITAASGWVTFSLSFDAPDGFVDMSRHDADGGVIPPDPTTVLEVDILVLTGNSPFTITDVSIDTVGISDAGG